MIKTVIVEKLIRSRPLGNPHLKWEDYMKRDVKAVDPRANWKEVAEGRERWRKICCDINYLYYGILKISRSHFL